MFTLFINDLTDLFDSSTTSKLFADDIKIYSEISISCNLDVFQIHLDAVYNWAKTWQIDISFSKCNLIVIGNLAACSDYKLSEHIILKVDNVRDLGVGVDSKLNFKTQIKDITTRAKQRSALSSVASYLEIHATSFSLTKHSFDLYLNTLLLSGPLP